MYLHDVAADCLGCDGAAEKVLRTRDAAEGWRNGAYALAQTAVPGVVDIAVPPGIPARLKLVHPYDVPKRKLTQTAGRRAFVHAIAHIEFNAINLAWDCVARYRGMPREFYDDWVRVAAEEAEHFALLRARLNEYDCDYGDYPGHNGLWEMAEKTAHDLAARMGMVPRYLEARGLDVTPGMIDRMTKYGDDATADVLRIIYEQEISHVEIGSRWFRWSCARAGVEPDAHFAELLGRYLTGPAKGPFNLDARRRAGFSETELNGLTAAAEND